MIYVLQISNHPEAGLRIPTEAGAASWKTIYDGHIKSDKAARAAVDRLSQRYRHARVFKGKTIGKLHYEVLR